MRVGDNRGGEGGANPTNYPTTGSEDCFVNWSGFPEIEDTGESSPRHVTPTCSVRSPSPGRTLRKQTGCVMYPAFRGSFGLTSSTRPAPSHRPVSAHHVPRGGAIPFLDQTRPLRRGAPAVTRFDGGGAD